MQIGGPLRLQLRKRNRMSRMKDQHESRAGDACASLFATRDWKEVAVDNELRDIYSGNSLARHWNCEKHAQRV